MPPDLSLIAPTFGQLTRESTTQLVQDTCRLEILGHKFALISVAASTLRTDMLASQISARDVLQDLLTTRSRLQNSYANALEEGDAALAQLMTQAFSRDHDALFGCFEMMARNICFSLTQGKAPARADLCELVTFVECQLSDAIAQILAAIRSIASAASTDIERLAHIDALTGLSNRHALESALCNKEAAGAPKRAAAIMQIDLDRFKVINNSMGHAAGDAALKHAANAIASSMGGDELLARVGGDEFVLVIFGPHAEEGLKQRAELIMAGISTPFSFAGKRTHIGASVGIAIKAKSDPISLTQCLAHAELALHQAKKSGRGTFRLFTPLLRSQNDQKDTLRSQIREGIDAQQFEPFYQPQVEGRTGKIVGLESLARWHHPKRGILVPYQFLDAAQDAGLLEELDEYLMTRTFAAMRRWLDDGLDIPQVSINLTGTRLLEVDLVTSILGASDSANIAPSMIGIEILESAMIDNDSKQMLDNIAALVDAGFKLELDDFGTGHASISNLKTFKVDRIKIDRSFVKDVHLYSELSKITGAMIGLAHALRIDALAEGVETPEERLVLNALGCDHFQGFGVSRPIPGCEIPRWIKKTQRKKALPSARK